MKSMRKKLIVSGCSFTTKDYRSSAYPQRYTDYPKWPELLARKLDMDCINLAFSGAGNEFIFQTLCESIIRTPRDEIGMVVAAWSQSNRDDWQLYKDMDRMMYNETFMKGFTWHNHRLNKKGDVFSWVRSDVLKMITLQKLCEGLNIPFKQFQMITLFDGYISGLVKSELEIRNINEQNTGDTLRYTYEGDQKEDRKKCNAILLEYDQYINKDNFIGWPSVPRLGGYSFSSKVEKDGGKPDEELTVGKYDPHPNQQGHQKIAKELYESF
tara:strand:+ start:1847 stop:2653 length:807 start_codon:yes stop_codon:yes gene_type:complete